MKQATKHPLYTTWIEIKTRCYNPNQVRFHRYGGRGIKMCDRWLNDFWSFVDDMGLKPSKKHQIDRIDNNGDYEPDNCRWSTQQQQMQNRKRRIYKNSSSKYKGVVKTKENNWAVSCNCKYVGRFDTEYEAAEAYNKAAKEAFGEFAYLNKITSWEE